MVGVFIILFFKTHTKLFQINTSPNNTNTLPGKFFDFFSCPPRKTTNGSIRSNHPMAGNVTTAVQVEGVAYGAHRPGVSDSRGYVLVCADHSAWNAGYGAVHAIRE